MLALPFLNESLIPTFEHRICPMLYSLSQARELLAASPWLQDFQDDLRQDFLAATRLLPPFDRGNRVYNVGDAPDGIYGVVSGCFGFEIAPQEEGPQLVHQLRPGTWFGELAHILERPRLATMYATRTSQCVLVPRQALDTLLRSDLRLWKHMALALANATTLSFTVINDLMTRSPKRRLAAALLRVSGLRNDEPLEGAFLELDMTHNGLALLSNISRSTVAQYLQELEKEGYLACRYGKIVLTNPFGLRDWIRAPHG